MADPRTEIFASIPIITGTVQPVVDVKDWMEVILSKETSGQVVAGTQVDILPVGSGKGMSLPIDRPVKFLCGPDTRVYIAADTAGQRVAVITQPAIWVSEMIRTFGLIDHVMKALITKFDLGKAAPLTPEQVQEKMAGVGGVTDYANLYNKILRGSRDR